jgi:hypothetical protein
MLRSLVTSAWSAVELCEVLEVVLVLRAALGGVGIRYRYLGMTSGFRLSIDIAMIDAEVRGRGNVRRRS